MSPLRKKLIAGNWKMNKTSADGVALVQEIVAAAGYVAILVVNVVGHRGLVAPYGGAFGRLGTNPICIAVPGPTPETPFVLDMATSKVAVGKLRVAQLLCGAGCWGARGAAG